MGKLSDKEYEYIRENMELGILTEDGLIIHDRSNFPCYIVEAVEKRVTKRYGESTTGPYGIDLLDKLCKEGVIENNTRGTGAGYTWNQYELDYLEKPDTLRNFLEKHPPLAVLTPISKMESRQVTVESKADRETSIAHCPSESESLEHLAGYEVSQDPAKGAHPLCPICYHPHPPTLAESGCGHLD